jgi:hypothetical protein
MEVSSRGHASAALPPGTRCTGGRKGTSAGLHGAENLVFTGDRSPDRPARTEWLHVLNYPGPLLYHNKATNINFHYK